MLDDPVDEVGIHLAGRDIEEPAEEKARAEDGAEDRQQADDAEEFQGFHGDSPVWQLAWMVAANARGDNSIVLSLVARRICDS